LAALDGLVVGAWKEAEEEEDEEAEAESDALTRCC
jgi:hypothetical protein